MSYDRTGDPLDDTPPAGRTDCRKGGRCDGSGWVQVQPAYAAQQHPYPPNPELDATDEELAEHGRLVRRTDVLRGQVADSYYPCKSCNEAAFFRWAGGHHRPDHDQSACPECVELIHRPRRRAA